jgi:hypothetical protein
MIASVSVSFSVHRIPVLVDVHLAGSFLLEYSVLSLRLLAHHLAERGVQNV